MIPKGLVPYAVLNPSRSWEIQRGHRDREDLRARSEHPLRPSVAGDASVTGVRIAPIVTVTCGRRGLLLRLAWLIRASWLIRCTISPSINRITLINHAKPGHPSPLMPACVTRDAIVT